MSTVPLTVSGQSSTDSSDSRIPLFDYTHDEIRDWLQSAGHTPFRAKQLFEWIYRRGASDFDAMTNLSKDLRALLSASSRIYTGSIARESTADDGTRKLLLAFPDAASVETVWIPSERRNTACISSQVGCPVGCRFCASGIDGVERNLSAGEIVEQAMQVRRMIATAEADATPRPGPPFADRHDVSRSGASGMGDRLSNIVMMGMGEPLANYRNVVKALRILNASWGVGIGARKITVSTVGLPKQMRQLADEGMQLNLALSLHAPDDKLREELIPWGRGIRINELIEACVYYFEKTGREVTFEYVLLSGVNDEPAHADALLKLVRRARANVNLLRYNPVAGLGFERPSSEATFAFQKRLRDGGVNVHIRTSRGLGADAACGQLRRKTRATA